MRSTHSPLGLLKDLGGVAQLLPKSFKNKINGSCGWACLDPLWYCVVKRSQEIKRKFKAVHSKKNKLNEAGYVIQMSFPNNEIYWNGRKRILVAQKDVVRKLWKSLNSRSASLMVWVINRTFIQRQLFVQAHIVKSRHYNYPNWL